MRLTTKARSSLKSVVRSLTDPDLENAQKKLDEHILGTYTFLRISMCVLAFALPALLAWGGEWKLWLPDPLPMQHSLSAYYHANLLKNSCIHHQGVYRDLFVGILSAIAFSLLAYKGYTNRENWILNFAGVFLGLVAFFPMAWPEKELMNKIPKGCDFSPVLISADPRISLHLFSAIAFFICLILAIWLTSADSLKILEKGISKKKAMNPTELEFSVLSSLSSRIAWLKNIYTLFKYLIVVPIIIMGWAFLAERFHLPFSLYSMLIAEWAGIWTFALYWALKSFEFRQTKDGTIALASLGPSGS